MPSSLGPAEILVILVVALIVLGPKRLPDAGRQVGKALSEVRRWSRDFQGEMRGAFDPEGAATVTRHQAEGEPGRRAIAAPEAASTSSSSGAGDAEGSESTVAEPSGGEAPSAKGEEPA